MVMQRLVALVIVVILVGCGGGTSGTSGTDNTNSGTRLIVGSITDNLGQQIANAFVQVSGNTQGTTSNSEGEFSLQALVSDSFILELTTSEGEHYSTTVNDISPDSSVVQVNAEIQPGNSEIKTVSVEGRVSLSHGCPLKTKGTENKLAITLDSNQNDCGLVFRFRGSSKALQHGKVSVINNTCSNISYFDQGSELSGNLLTIFKGFRVNNQSKDCHTSFQVSFAGVVAQTHFEVSFKALHNTEPPAQQNPVIVASYQGQLALVDSSSNVDLCAHLKNDNVQLSYETSSRKITASVVGENIKANSLINRQATDEGERYQVVKSLSRGKSVQMLIITPVSKYGESTVDFQLQYLETSGSKLSAQQCRRSFAGQLRRIR